MILTVVEGRPLSHKELGWERFTNAVLRAMNRELRGVIFLLWGDAAWEKEKLIDAVRHKVLVAGHPSPLSCEKHFKGCNHFGKVNAVLRDRGSSEIGWALPS
eukprot:CAMPEP_0170612630 /NCGR_PEP_ID=MMETSP0224-20130122/23826_1 /TAXON_ID=285029 /ORGANISM="Togula jolla, Strain CCCM 725" /LENGTH=101 /DNA_ID=CAMNT_0010938147 /DNA_START=13 /DNA_END=318 /DNA_ORIENTATION=-